MQKKTASNIHIARLDNSVVFKKLFSDPDILNEFLKDLLDLDLQLTAEQIDTEKKFTPPVGNVDVAYDIFVDDPKNRIVIEIQRIRYAYHYDRFFYYFLVAIVELVKSYKSYNIDRTVYTIVWLTRQVKDKAFQESILTNTFVAETTKGTQMQLYPHKLIFLNPHYMDEDTPKGVADWMNLVVQSLEQPIGPELNYERDIFHKATELIAEDGLDSSERAEILDENDYEDNLRTNRIQGREEGREEGRAEGREEGRAEGHEEGQIENMHRVLFVQLAQKFTDVPEEVLAQIEQTDDLKQLEAWMVQLFTANSWEEVFR